MFGLLGIVAFFLALFVAGAIMEGNGAKAMKFGAALFVCSVVIIGWGPKGDNFASGNCWTDWDGRSNPTVCE